MLTGKHLQAYLAYTILGRKLPQRERIGPRPGPTAPGSGTRRRLQGLDPDAGLLCLWSRRPLRGGTYGDGWWDVDEGF